jgi:Ca2+:H+ antiporter
VEAVLPTRNLDFAWLARYGGRREYAADVARRLLWASLLLAPATLVADLLGAAEVELFVLAALALVPLAWLIGEATEHAAEHTGPGIGGFLNASFGNAPELIIALLAVSSGLPNVVRGSLTGSIVSNLLLVLGLALAVAGTGKLDRRSLLVQAAIVGVAVCLFFIPSVPGWHGDPERHELALLSIPVAAILLAVYAAVTIAGLRRHKRLHEESGHTPHAESWGLGLALVVLAVATLATAVVSEILVHSLHAFAHAAGISEFAVATVIVAIVGNAAEHGSAVVIAHRGKIRLASEIPVSSAAQVGVLVVPLVALLSFAFPHPLPLSFRPIELAAMAGAVALVALVVGTGRVSRAGGILLVAAYLLCAGAFFAAGDR